MGYDGPTGDSASSKSYLSAGPDGRILVPDAHLLFSGDYSRAGSDLHLRGDGAETVVFPQYFSSDHPADLISPEGALLTGDVVSRLAGPRYPMQYAQATPGPGGAAPIGRVETASGSATATRTDGSTAELGVGGFVYQGDVVSTADGANVSITFTDRTVLSLSASSRMVLDQHVYAPGGTGNSMLVNVVQGAFVFVSGAIAGSGQMRVETPVASMGIRGTSGIVQVSAVDGATDYTLVPDPNGSVGAFDVFIKNTNQLLQAFRASGESLRIVNVTGTTQQIVKEPTQQQLEQQIIAIAFVAFALGQARVQPGTDPVTGAPVPAGPPGVTPPGGQQPGQPAPDPTTPGTTTPPPGPRGDLGDAIKSAASNEPALEQLVEKSGLGDLMSDTTQGTLVSLLSDTASNTAAPSPTTTDTTAPPAVVTPPPPDTPPPPTGPQLTLPATQIVAEDGSITVAGVSVTSANPVTVTIVALSTVTLAQTTGLTFITGDGVADEVVQFTGSAADVQAALDGLIYTATPDNDGTGGITILVNADGITQVGTIDVSIVPQPDAPTAADATMATAEDTAVGFTAADFGFADVDTGDSLSSVTIASLPVGGTLALNGTPVVAGQVISAAEITGLTYTPEANEFGPAYSNFQFTVQDQPSAANPGGQSSAEQTITFNVTPVNDTPVTAFDFVPVGTLKEDVSVAFGSAPGQGVLANDISFDTPGNRVVAVQSTGVQIPLPTAGTLTIDGSYGQLTIDALGNYTYLLGAGAAPFDQPLQEGQQVVDRFFYYINDNGALDFEALGQLDINVTGTNDPVVATPFAQTESEDVGAFQINLQTNATDPDLGPFPSIVTGPGTITSITTADGRVLERSTATLSNDFDWDTFGTFSMFSMAKFQDLGAGETDSFVFTFDLADGFSTTPNSVTVTITGANDAPTSADTTIIAQAVGSFTFSPATFPFADVDAGDARQSIRIVSLPAAGTLALALAGAVVVAGQVILATAISNLTFTPDAGAAGANYASFTFTVSDGALESAAQTLTVDVNANAPPTVDQGIADQSIAANSALNFQVPASAFADPGDTLTLVATLAGGGALPAWLGFIPATGTFTGTPIGTDFGPVQVQVTATDTANSSISDIFVLTVAPDFAGDANGITDDAITGNANSNYIEGRDGSDVIAGLAGNDVIFGNRLGLLGIDTDTVTYAASPAAINANLATGLIQDGFGTTDQVFGIENVIGSDFADTLTGNAGINRLEGGAGIDFLEGGLGTDVLIGGAGDDLFFVDNADTVDGGTDIDTVQADPTTDATGFTFSVAGTNVERVQGRDGNDSITGVGVSAATALFLVGFSGNDTIAGGAGDDVILGDGAGTLNPGNDVLDGGEGFDQISGGDGDDIIIGGGATSFPFGDLLFGEGGNDTITGGGNGRLIGGTGSDTIFGADGDLILANEDDDTITGDAGVQFIEPGQGNDTIDGGSGIDWVDYRNETGTAGIDLNMLAGTATDTFGTTDTFTNIENIIGSNLADTITGNANANVLRGEAGNDVLTGGLGSDTLDGGSGADLISIPSTTFALIDGGADQDTLALTGGITLSLPATAGTTLQNIEAVDLSGLAPGSNNSLAATAAAVRAVSDVQNADVVAAFGSTAPDSLLVHGNAGDAINLSDAGWSNTGPTAVIGGETYALYQNTAGGLVHVAIDADITVTGGNAPPTTADAAVTTNEDTAFTFAAANFPFTDADAGDTLQSITVVSVPLAGTLTLAGNAVPAGQVVTAAQIPTLVFAPAANANGAAYASFDFRVSDGSATSALAETMTISVAPVNDLPIAAPDTVPAGLLKEDTAGQSTVTAPPLASVLANDTGIDGPPRVVGIQFAGNPVVGVPAIGTASIDGFYGTLTIAADGSYSYSLNPSLPAADSLAEGQIAADPFVYFVTDSAGTVAEASAQLSINVTGTNDAPTTAPFTITFSEDAGAFQGNLLTNYADADLSGTINTVNGLNAITTAVGRVLTVNVDYQWNDTGTFSMNSNGLAQFQGLAAGQADTFDFTYGLFDGFATTPNTMTVVITGANDAPLIQADGINNTGALTEGSATNQVTRTLPVADPDAGTVFTWSIDGGTAAAPANYVVSMNEFTVTNIAIEPDPQSITYIDSFADGVAPPEGPTATGVGTPSYVAPIGTFAESLGSVRMTAATSGLATGVGTDDPIIGHRVRLNTDASTNLNLGLKRDDNFTVTGTFDLFDPLNPAVSLLPDDRREYFGIRLTDGSAAVANPDDIVELIVRRNPAGELLVQMRELDVAADTVTSVGLVQLTPPAGATQIQLSLEHPAANVGVLIATFSYLDAAGIQIGTATTIVQQNQAGRIFGAEPGSADPTEAHTRAEFMAFSPQVLAAAKAGTYGTLAIEQNGTWTYTLDNLDADTQALADGQTATDLFTVRAGDGTVDDAETVTITVTGTNDAPIIIPATDTRTLTENGQAFVTSGSAAFTDVDLIDTHTLSVANPPAATLSNGAAVSLALLEQLSLGFSATITNQATGDGAGAFSWTLDLPPSALAFLTAGQSLTTVYTLAIADNQGGSANELVTITINGADQAPALTFIAEIAAGTVPGLTATRLLNPGSDPAPGPDPANFYGSNVSGAGDLNNDGFADILVKYIAAQNGVTTSGQVRGYTVYGGQALPGDVSLATLDGTNGFTFFDGTEFLNAQTHALSGDYNGDGITDVVVVSDGTEGSPNGYQVLFGGQAFPTAVTPPVTPPLGINITDPVLSFARSAANAGDINGDGFDDLLLAADNVDAGSLTGAGRVDVLFGSTTLATADVSVGGLDGSNGFTMLGLQAGDRLGSSLNGIGDINGDAIGDFLVHANVSARTGLEAAGEAYIVFGKSTGWNATLDLATLNGTNGFTIQAQQAGALVGFSPAAAGDVNGDGIGDFIFSEESGTHAAYVVFGRTSGWSPVLDLAQINGSNGFLVTTANGAGIHHTAGIGDFNGDGYDDIVVGQREASTEFRGEPVIIFGRPDGSHPTSISVTDINGSNGIRLLGDTAGVGFDGSLQAAVSPAGDVNGDGFDDMIVGATAFADSYIVYGGNVTGAVLADNIGGTGDDTLTGSSASDVLIGGLGNDTLFGNGSLATLQGDVLRGGAGSDIIVVSDTTFLKIDGGLGIDTLALDGSSLTLDLTAISNLRTESIEIIDIGGTGANTLQLRDSDVIDLSETLLEGSDAAPSHNNLVIQGDADDTVNLSDQGWQPAGTTTINGGTYNVFTLTAGEVLASITIEQPVQVVNP